MGDLQQQEDILDVRHKFRDVPPNIRQALQQQDDLVGWLQFTYGRLTREWKDAQDEWLKRMATKWKKSVRKWSGTVIQVTLEVTWGMWVHRNATLHDATTHGNLKGEGGWMRALGRIPTPYDGVAPSKR